jgi:alkylhydroperoxidase family enzyme
MAVVGDWEASQLFSVRERLALYYADAMTVTGRETTDEIFVRVREEFGDDGVVELTEVIAWENASSKFNRALRIPSQRLWRSGE